MKFRAGAARVAGIALAFGPRMKRRAAAAVLASIAAAACDTSSLTTTPPPAITPGASCEDEPDPHCANPIDRVLIPQLRGIDAPIADAPAFELCRRMAIDLLGRIPTESELATCSDATPIQMAELFMAQPDYLYAQKRAWGERIPFDSSLAWYGHILELDARIGDAFAENGLAYDQLAAELAVHPAFYARHQGDDWAANVIALFLGRTARPDEIAGLRPLSYVWNSRAFCDGAAMYNLLLDDDTLDPTICDLTQDEIAVSFCSCLPGDGTPGCKTDVFGAMVDFGTDGCPNPEDPDGDENLFRATATGLGDRSECPDGRAGCPDLRVADDDSVTGPITPLAPVSAEQRARLFSLGAALAARDDFWEAAVDRELKKFLGWWQASFRKPDSDLPAVRRALTEEFRRTRSLRALQKSIVTSLIYTRSASSTAEQPWAAGPTKLLTAESWIDSAALVAGQIYGNCDYRLVSAENETYLLVDENLIEYVEPTIPDADYYLAAQRLGGCTSDQPRPNVSSLGMAYAEHGLAVELCAASAVDPGVDLDTAARTLARRAWSRELDDAEAALFVAEMESCLAAGPIGCETNESAVRWLCVRMIDSAEFSLY